MRLVWSDRALRHVAEIGAYLAQHNPVAQVRILEAIARSSEGLVSYPKRGRPGRVARTRELPVLRTPYVIAYRVGGHTIDVLAIVHGRQKWPKRF